MIINQLIQTQRAKNLTDEQFAHSLGIHRLSWVRNKRTKVISSDTLLRVFQVYPELREKFLSSFVTGKDKEVTAITTIPSQTHQDGKLARFRGWLRGFIKGSQKIFFFPKANSATDSKSSRRSVIKN